MERGRFIVVEGGEGAGKSTQIRHLKTWLESRGRPVLLTREPGGTELAEKVRELLLDPGHGEMTPDAELLLVFAARADHLSRLVVPALDRGTWVVSDRFTDATFAYQGAGRGIEASRIEALESWVQGTLRPDRVIVLDMPPGEGAARIAERGSRDRFEREAAAFFERVRRCYLDRARADPARYRVVDGSGSVATVRARVAAALDGLA